MKNPIDLPPKNLLCFSHLRWDFVYQRPQHLLSRYAKEMNVYFFEEPIFDTADTLYLSISQRSDTLNVVVPHLPKGIDQEQTNLYLTSLLDKFLEKSYLDNFIFWYYTPMALNFSDKYKPKMVVYDCMDELSAFKYAPKELVLLEKKLLAKADVVFTGGHSLYEAKKQQHANISPYPSSIEKDHFVKARVLKDEPIDQESIYGPKIGFYGVIDERFDLDLIGNIAKEKPNWQIILIGPIAKINPENLPKAANIHYLGQKSYEELPKYLCGWNVAMLPFLLNESTRYISPTKTPEYLAAGIPVVSTPIRDVVKPYGIQKLVHIASTSEDFIKCIDMELTKECNKAWLQQVDRFLKNVSWDNTFSSMKKQITAALTNKSKISIAS